MGQAPSVLASLGLSVRVGPASLRRLRHRLRLSGALATRGRLDQVAKAVERRQEAALEPSPTAERKQEPVEGSGPNHLRAEAYERALPMVDERPAHDGECAAPELSAAEDVARRIGGEDARAGRPAYA